MRADVVGRAMRLIADGRIVVAGATAGPNTNFTVARLAPQDTTPTGP